MSKFVTCVSVLILVSFFVSATPGISFAGDKSGYVEVGVLFEQYEKTKEVETKITGLAEKKQAERDAIVETIRKMKDELVVLAEGEKKVEVQNTIDQKIKELQMFDDQSRRELTQIRDENVKEIFDDIDTAIQTFGDKKGYDVLFSDKALLYKKEKDNVTEEVLQELNKA